MSEKIIQSWNTVVIEGTGECFWGNCSDDVVFPCPPCHTRGWSWSNYCAEHSELHHILHETERFRPPLSSVEKLKKRLGRYSPASCRHKPWLRRRGVTGYYIECALCKKELGFRDLHQGDNGRICNIAGMRLETLMRKERSETEWNLPI